MTRDEALQFTERRFDAYRRHDATALAAAHTETGVIVSPMFATVHGRAAIEGSYRSLFTAFPDWEMTGDEPIVDGHRIAQVMQITATHMSEAFGMPGTGKRIGFTCVVITTHEGGLIAHERRIYDFTGVLMQIGVLKGKMGR